MHFNVSYRALIEPHSALCPNIDQRTASRAVLHRSLFGGREYGHVPAFLADSLDRLNQFSADPDYCAGKFPVVSDTDGKIAKSYNLTSATRAGAKDVRGVEINHAFIERVTYVIGKDHKIVATLSSADDKISPDQHVHKALEIVQKLK